MPHDMFLDCGQYPPSGIGRKTHISFGIKTIGGLHQSDIAFLNQIGKREAVALESGGNSDHQPNMGRDDFMQRVFVPLFAPATRQFGFVGTLKKWRVHCG